MSVSKLSSVRLNAAARRRVAYEHRLRGLSYQAIGDLMDISKRRAHQLVEKAYADAKAHLSETAEQVARLDLDRLDQMIVTHLARAVEGDTKAGDLVLRIIDRRARMLGLDAPTKVEGQFSLSHLSDAELEAEAVRLGIATSLSLPNLE